jgi:hypothetical protein
LLRNASSMSGIFLIGLNSRSLTTCEVHRFKLAEGLTSYNDADSLSRYQLLVEVGKDLSQTGRSDHSLVAYGSGDCVSLEPFRNAAIKMTKLDMFSLLVPIAGVSTIPGPEFSPDAIAAVGMAGRFPGANNVEELWEVVNSGKSMFQEQPKERVNFQDSHRVRSDKKWASKQKFYGNFISDHDSFDHAFFRISGKEANYSKFPKNFYSALFREGSPLE